MVFLILTSLFPAGGLRKHLTRRLALTTILMSGGGRGALLFGLIGISALLPSFHVGRKHVHRLDLEPALRQVKELGGISRKEKEILFILSVAACLWVGGPPGSANDDYGKGP